MSDEQSRDDASSRYTWLCEVHNARMTDCSTVLKALISVHFLLTSELKIYPKM